jgi:hypothetical protein
MISLAPLADAPQKTDEPARPTRKKTAAFARVGTRPVHDEISPRTAHRKILEARKGVM